MRTEEIGRRLLGVLTTLSSVVGFLALGIAGEALVGVEPLAATRVASDTPTESALSAVAAIYAPVAVTVPVPDGADCAETATIDWGGEELTGELYWSPCVEVSIKIVECSWCGCGYIVDLPNGGHYTFNDTSDGGGLECGFDSPVNFH